MKWPVRPLPAGLKVGLVAAGFVVAAATLAALHRAEDAVFYAATLALTVAAGVFIWVMVRGLRSSEQRFRALVNNALDAVITMDARGAITSWSPQAEAAFGWSADEAEGRPLVETIIPRQYRDAHRLGLAHFLATGEGPILRRRIEITALHRDGREFPVELTVTPTRVGHSWQFSAFVRDITQRLRSEQVQRATYRIAEAANTAAGLRELLGAIHEIVGELLPAENFYIALHDAAGLLTFPYFVDARDPAPQPRPLGRGLTEYVLRTGLPLLVTPDAHRTLERRGEVELLGAPSIDWIGVPLKAADRTIGVLVIQSYTEGVRYGEREMQILQFVSTQVAMAIEHKRVEERLKESETKYRLIFEASPEAMWVYDVATLRFLAVNDAAVRRYGYTRDEFLDRRTADVEESATGAGLRHRTKDGRTIEVESSSDAIEFAGRPARLVLVRDVTEQRQLEGQLRQAQKMDAVGRLAGGLAHDFNNLLTAITGYGDLVLGTLPADDARRADVEEIRIAADRAAALTQQLLAFSRKQVLQPRVLDLNVIVRNAEKLLRRLIGEHIALETVLDPALAAVKADPTQLEQVIVNLAVNARDAMPQGGRLRLETRNAQLDTGYTSEHSMVQPGEYVQLAVSDTGLGMDEQTKARLFEPFFTTKELGKGTGLGLSTVYGIVKQSGGYIWVYSELGLGTTFKVYLPQVEAAATVDLPATAPQAAPRGSETVLVVEDEPALRAVARRVLQRQGYAVLEAADGGAALALVSAHQGPLDLLVTDVVMPGLSGRDLADRLTAARPDLRVLYVSGYSGDAIADHGILGPDLAYLEKPFSPDALAMKVREVLDRPPRGPPAASG
jgi:hypothetical protein